VVITRNIVNPFNIVFNSRGYELDAEGIVPAHVLLRYMEHLRWEYTRRDLRELVALFRQGYTFVVVSQALRISGDIGLAIPIRGNLWISRTGRSSIVFQHTFHHVDNGELFAAGSTVVVFLAPDNVPTRLPDILEQADTDLPMMPDLTPPEFTEMPPAPFERSYRVRTGDLDLQGHMNQANYAAFYDDTRQAAAGQNVYGPDGAGIGRIRFLHLDYVRPATTGEKLVVATWPIGGKPLSLGFAMHRNDALISRAVIQA
jgi:acyl-CoA thioesterase FadM